MNDDNVTCFDCFRVEYIPEETKKIIGNKNIINIFIANCSIMYGYFYFGFIDFMLKGKRLLDYTKIIFPNQY